MTRIRVNPDILFQSSGNISSAGQGTKKIGDDLWQSAQSAPSYNGQFGPAVRAIAQGAMAQAQGHQNRLADKSLSLNKRAQAFSDADVASVLGIQNKFVSFISLPPPVTLKSILSTIMGDRKANTLFETRKMQEKLDQIRTKKASYSQLLMESKEISQIIAGLENQKAEIDSETEHYEKTFKMYEEALANEKSYRFQNILNPFFIILGLKDCNGRIKNDEEKIAEIKSRIDSLKNTSSETEQKINNHKKQQQEITEQITRIENTTKISDGRISQNYEAGSHKAIDITASGHVPIEATAVGTVRFSRDLGDDITYTPNSGEAKNVAANDTRNYGYGNEVIVEYKYEDQPLHIQQEWKEVFGLSEGQSLYVQYAHLKTGTLAFQGQTVSLGDQIGVMGSSGVATGQHLHLAVAKGNSGCMNENAPSHGTSNWARLTDIKNPAISSAFVPS